MLLTGMPRPIYEEWEWQFEAACRGRDHDLFFPPHGERGPLRDARVAAAKRVCAMCPVVDECLRFALRTNQRYGVWGGLAEEERGPLLTPPAGDRPRSRRAAG